MLPVLKSSAENFCMPRVLLRIGGERKFLDGRELDDPFGEQYGDAVNDRKLPGAACTADSACLELQGLAADGTGEPAEVLCG